MRRTGYLADFAEQNKYCTSILLYKNEMMISEKYLEFHLPGGSPQPHICSSTNQKHPAGFGARQGWELWVGAAPVDVEQEGQ